MILCSINLHLTRLCKTQQVMSFLYDIYTYIYIYIYIYLFIHLHTHTHTYIYIYTHTLSTWLVNAKHNDKTYSSNAVTKFKIISIPHHIT